MRRAARLLGWALALAGIAILLAALAFWYDMERTLTEPVYLADDPLEFNIPRGASMRAIAQALAREGVVDRSLYLRIDARLRRVAGRMQAGEYLLRSGLTPRQILDKFARGDVRHYAITFAEGLSFREMRSRIDAHPKLTHTLAGQADAEIMTRLSAAEPHPEGLFFPDTYHFTAGAQDIELLHRAYARMQEVLDRHWQARAPDLPYRTPYEALILASIVERETGLAEERPHVAGVLVRRLQLGMRLQADPTVIYGLGSAFDGDLRSQDLSNDTPYNTYQRVGLPPTPIAMPGEAAIAAALHPEGGDDLYFVAKGDGSHHFSASLDEHARAVARFEAQRQ